MNEKFKEYVLVVDDERELALLHVETLEEAGIPALAASTKEEALALAAVHPLCFLLTDYSMPDINGVDLAKILQQKIPHLKSVLITGFADRHIAVEALKSGFIDLLDKPVDSSTLVNLARKIYQKRQKELEQDVEEAAILRATFVEESSELLLNIDDLILGLESSENKLSTIQHLFRVFHTIKGSSGSIDGAQPIKKLAHAVETCLSTLKEKPSLIDPQLISHLLSACDVLKAGIEVIRSASPLDERHSLPLIQIFEHICADAGPMGTKAEPLLSKPQAASTPLVEDKDEAILVTTEKLDAFMDLAGELVAFRNYFRSTLRADGLVHEGKRQTLVDLDTQLTKLSDQVQSHIMSLRKVKLSKVFSKLQRVVRQASHELGKSIKLELQDDGIAIDKLIASALSNSLVHMVRNSCDHGIEDGTSRVEKGKPAAGTIVLKAMEKDDRVVVTMLDDGRGLDRQRILEKAIKQGLASKEEGAVLSDGDVFDFIFQSGFSTADQVSEISGRGVGLDAVRSNISALGGSIKIETEPGRFTSMVLTIPTPKTVIVADSLIAESSGVSFAIPLTGIAEVCNLQTQELNEVGGRLKCQYRGQTVPIERLDSIYRMDDSANLDQKPDERALLVIVSHRGKHVGLRIDRIVDQIEAVVRPFTALIKGRDGFKGTSIIGDDRVAYVVSAEDVVQMVHSFRPSPLARGA